MKDIYLKHGLYRWKDGILEIIDYSNILFEKDSIEERYFFRECLKTRDGDKYKPFINMTIGNSASSDIIKSGNPIKNTAVYFQKYPVVFVDKTDWSTKFLDTKTPKEQEDSLQDKKLIGNIDCKTVYWKPWWKFFAKKKPYTVANFKTNWYKEGFYYNPDCHVRSIKYEGNFEFVVSNDREELK